MKIRLAILEPDKSYLNRIVSAFCTKYADELEIYSFTELEIAYEALRKHRINVFLASEECVIDKTEVPGECGFAYLVGTPGIESLYGEAALCKFQKAELIYKQVLSIFSDQISDITGLFHHEATGKVIGFLPLRAAADVRRQQQPARYFWRGKGKKYCI